MGLVERLPKLRDMRGICFVKDIIGYSINESRYNVRTSDISGEAHAEGYYGRQEGQRGCWMGELRLRSVRRNLELVNNDRRY